MRPPTRGWYADDLGPDLGIANPATGSSGGAHPGKTVEGRRGSPCVSKCVVTNGGGRGITLEDLQRIRERTPAP